MKKRRNLALLAAAAMMVSVLGGCGGSGSAKETSDGGAANAENSSAAGEDAEGTTDVSGEYKIVIATSAYDPEITPAFNNWGPGIVKFKETAEELSNGRIEVEIFWNSTLGNDSEMFRMMMDGEVDINFGSGFSTVDPRFSWKLLPFLFTSDEQLKEKFASKGSPGFELNSKIYDENGIKLLSQNPGVQQGFMSKKGLVKRPEDLKGMTFRAYEDSVVTTFFNGLTNTAVIPYNELYTSMQNGTVDVATLHIPAFVGDKFYEICDYYTFLPWQYTSYALMMNGDRFASLPADIRDILVEAAWACSDESWRKLQEFDETKADELASLGVETYTPTDEEMQLWVDYSNKLSDKWKELIGAELYDEVMKIMAE